MFFKSFIEISLFLALIPVHLIYLMFYFIFLSLSFAAYLESQQCGNVV